MTKKKQLVAFGCSHTFGHSLPDAHPPVTNQPSKFAWPQLLADELNMKCINKGKPGASTKTVLFNVVNYENYKSDSEVIILWPNADRNSILHKNKHGHLWSHDFLPGIIGMKFPQTYYDNLGMTFKEHQEFLKFYYERIHNDYDASFDMATRVSYVDNYLRRKHIIPIHLVADHFSILTDFKNMLPPMKVKEINWEKDFRIDLALDNQHPGINSNKLLAKNIKKWFFK